MLVRVTKKDNKGFYYAFVLSDTEERDDFFSIVDEEGHVDLVHEDRVELAGDSYNEEEVDEEETKLILKEGKGTIDSFVVPYRLLQQIVNSGVDKRYFSYFSEYGNEIRAEFVEKGKLRYVYFVKGRPHDD